jgi:endonuclease VIII-like 1
MPELAEVKIMSDFINNVVSEEGFFDSLEKSEVSKVKTELNPFEGAVFTMHAKSRGKELMLHLELVGGDIDGAVTKNLICTMGMSGNWIYIRKDAPQLEKALKHGHLRFQSTKGNWLILYDPRRFAKWKWVDGWSAGRGYCPLTEFNDFQYNLLTHWYEDKYFNKPLSEVMMNQSAFNGVGNYLRAEILYRLDVDPFQPANKLSIDELHDLMKITHNCVRDAYVLGGGQLKDWHNPMGTDASSFKEWMKCYSILESVIDGSKRRFWYDPKWKVEKTDESTK